MIATVGAIKDFRGRTIPNWLTYSGISSGLALRAFIAGWPALKTGCLGLLIGGGFFYLLFIVPAAYYIVYRRKEARAGKGDTPEVAGGAPQAAV